MDGQMRQARFLGVREDVKAKPAASQEPAKMTRITHASRVVFPQANVTKGEIAAYQTMVQQLRNAAVAHLDHEEAELEDVYQQNRDHPEIKAMGKKFAKVSPARGGR